MKTSYAALFAIPRSGIKTNSPRFSPTILGNHRDITFQQDCILFPDSGGMTWEVLFVISPQTTNALCPDCGYQSLCRVSIGIQQGNIDCSRAITEIDYDDGFMTRDRVLSHWGQFSIGENPNFFSVHHTFLLSEMEKRILECPNYSK
jgi:hypothetical protein